MGLSEVHKQKRKFFLHHAASRGLQCKSIPSWNGFALQILKFLTEIAVYIRLYRKQYKIGPLLLCNFNRKS